MTGARDTNLTSAMVVLRYDVSLHRDTLGDLLALDGRAARAAGGTRKCWEALQGRPQPCDGCPLFAGGTRSEKVSLGTLASNTGPHQVLEVRRRNGTAKIRLLRVDDKVASALCTDKLRRIGARAQLSAQETKVLELIATGCQTKEIASALGIGVRTAKFHGANLLRKIGVDSRLAILGMIVGSEPPAQLPNGRKARATASNPKRARPRGSR